jgi:transcriptional regulator with XRE-family HTH domain
VKPRPYATFGARLRVAMTQRDIKVADLAAQLDMDQSTIIDWRSGKRLPRLASAAALSDAIHMPSLSEYVVELRSMKCALCSKAFIYDNVGGRRRKFCSQDCASSSWNSVHRSKNEREWGMVHTRWRNRFRKAQKAIDRFCLTCEWDGVCKTPDCELRSVSPLPLAVERVA